MGYSLQSNGGCAINATANVFQNCAFLLFGTFCLACNPGSYFNPDGNCEPIDPNCVTFDYIFDVCTTCKTGYVYYQSRNLCVKNNSPPDAGCTSWIGDVCFSCVNGWTLYDGICVIANPNCRSRSLDFPFNCVACYPGYTLSGINCLPTPVNNPLCAVFDSFGACLVCSFRSLKNALGVCVLVNPLCNTFDQNGFCLSCYQGYILSAGKCILPSDPNCLQWSGSTCVQCIPWTYYNGVNCIQVSTACRTFSSVNGKCTSCYVGWNLSNGVCSVSASNNDPNCKTFNSNGVCTACYGGYYYDVGQGKCLVSTKSCNGMDFYGNCLGCYQGYYLKAGDCYIIPSNCKTYDGTNNVCTSCYPGSTLSNGKCIWFPTIILFNSIYYAVFCWLNIKWSLTLSIKIKKDQK